jgi:small GTP-binding protein
MQRAPEYVFKIAVMGEASVGKTSMILQFSQKTFSSNYIQTLGANFAMKKLFLEDYNIQVNLQLWDLAGQVYVKYMLPEFLIGSSAAILVYDITQRQTYENIPMWKEEAERHIQVPFVLIGNKVDLESQRMVTNREGELMQERLGALLYQETSAKTAKNLDNTFMTLTRSLVEQAIARKQALDRQ